MTKYNLLGDPKDCTSININEILINNIHLSDEFILKNYTLIEPEKISELLHRGLISFSSMIKLINNGDFHKIKFQRSYLSIIDYCDSIESYEIILNLIMNDTKLKKIYNFTGLNSKIILINLYTKYNYDYKEFLKYPHLFSLENICESVPVDLEFVDEYSSKLTSEMFNHILYNMNDEYVYDYLDKYFTSNDNWRCINKFPDEIIIKYKDVISKKLWSNLLKYKKNIPISVIDDYTYQFIDWDEFSSNFNKYTPELLEFGLNIDNDYHYEQFWLYFNINYIFNKENIKYYGEYHHIINDMVLYIRYILYKDPDSNIFNNDYDYLPKKYAIPELYTILKNVRLKEDILSYLMNSDYTNGNTYLGAKYTNILSVILKHQIVSENFIKEFVFDNQKYKFNDDLNLIFAIFRYQKVSLLFIKEILRKYDFIEKSQMVHTIIQEYQEIDDVYLKNYSDYLNLSIIINNQKLSEEYIIENEEKIEPYFWDIISSKYPLSDNFIEKYIHKLNTIDLLSIPNLNDNILGIISKNSKYNVNINEYKAFYKTKEYNEKLKEMRLYAQKHNLKLTNNVLYAYINTNNFRYIHDKSILPENGKYYNNWKCFDNSDNGIFGKIYIDGDVEIAITPFDWFLYDEYNPRVYGFTVVDNDNW